MDLLTGQLLVAGPKLLDPNFVRTVVLVAEHGPAGALGLVLNRPSDATVGDAVPDLVGGLDAEEPMWVGGPVKPDGVLVLAEWTDPDPAAGLVVGAVGLLGADADIAALPESAARCRAYAGFAGWGPEQLDQEVEREDWILAPARADEIFTESPETLWSEVLTEMGGRFALLARMPLDPSVN